MSQVSVSASQPKDRILEQKSMEMKIEQFQIDSRKGRTQGQVFVRTVYC